MTRPELVDNCLEHGSNITMTRPLAAARKYIMQLEAEVERLREEAHWIPVSESLPDCDALVLLRVDNGIPEPLIDIAFCDDHLWFYRTGGLIEEEGNTTVTHWRPLPEPPDVQP